MAWSDVLIPFLPSAEQMAKRALFRARRSLVTHEQQARYHASMAAMHRELIEHLTDELSPPAAQLDLPKVVSS